MADFKLSICIATLNRADYIGDTLNSIVSQINRDVEIVIVDGASTDNTGDVVRHYQKLNPNIHYFRLNAKGGVDQDYSKAVELAKGEYCWLMTDDDIFKPDAVKVVFDAMQPNNDLIIVNAEVRSADLKDMIEEKRLCFETDQTYKPLNMERFFYETASYLSFIGCVVIKKEVWDSRVKEKYFGTLFVHVGVIFQKAFLHNVCVISRPLISIRYGNALWLSTGFEIWTFRWPRLIWSFDLFSAVAKSKVCHEEPWRKMTSLALYRGLGSYSLKEYRQLIAPCLNSKFEKLKAILVAIFPAYIINPCLVIYLSLVKKNSRLSIVDLKSSRFNYLRLF